MALINSINNTASVIYNDVDINSNTVTTLLLLPPLITKSVDKLIANPNEVLTYTITITNPSLSAMTNLPFVDIIPEGTTYLTGSFRFNGTAASPTLSDGTLRFTIPNIPALGVATIVFQVTITENP